MEGCETHDDALRRRLEDLALEGSSADLFGVASPDRFDGAPAGNGPADYLPGVRAVIVLGMKIPEGVMDVAGHYDEPGKTMGPYMWYGYVVPNWDLSSAAARVAKALERAGFKGLPFPPTGLNYKFGSRADFSHRHAAVAAGLGEFGLSALVLTPDFGAWQRFVSILTDAPLRPSPMYAGPSLCRPAECGRACMRSCPTGALAGRVEVTVGGRQFGYARTDTVRCRWPFAKKGYRRTKLSLPDDTGEEEFRRLMRSTPLHPHDADLSQFTFVPQCGACMFRCPSPHFT